MSDSAQAERKLVALVNAMRLRWGDHVTNVWFGLSGLIQQMFLASVRHISSSADMAVAPEVLMLVMRIPSSEPDGAFAVVGHDPDGQMDVAGRIHALRSALADLEAGRDLLPLGADIVAARAAAAKRPEFLGGASPSHGSIPSSDGDGT